MKNITLIFIILSLISCASENSTNHLKPHQTISVQLNDTKENTNGFLNSIEDINVIPLEIDSSVILVEGKIQLRVTSERIIVFDNKTNKIFAFSKSGEFLFKINKYGHGPGEYLRPANIFLNHKLDICLYDKATKKIQFYDSSGNSIMERITDIPADNVTFLNDTLFVAFAQHTRFFDKNNDGVKILNINGKTIRTFLPLPNWITNSSLTTASGSNFAYQNNTPNLIMPWDNNVYGITPDSIFCKYKIDFGKYNIPESFLKDNEDNINDDLIKITQTIQQQGWAYFLDFFQESLNHVYFTNMQGKNLLYTLYDKRTKNAKTIPLGSLPPEWYLITKPFLASQNETFYTFVSINQMNNLLIIQSLKDPRLIKVKNQYIQYKNKIATKLRDDDYILLSFKLK